MLTEPQIRHYDTFGFLVLPGLLTTAEVATANEEFGVRLATAKNQTEQRGIRKQFNWTNLGPDSPFLGSLLEDSRVHGQAKQLMKSEVVGMYANGNAFFGDRTEWHPDTGHLDRRGVKFAFYLQPLEADTGALRFIPGSHRRETPWQRYWDCSPSTMQRADRHWLSADGAGPQGLTVWAALTGMM